MNSNPREVVITGVGPVTGIGVGREALWASLIAGRSNAQRRSLLVDVGKTTELPVVSMPAVDSVPGLAKHMAASAEQGCEGYRALADAGFLQAYDRDQNTIGVIQAFEAPGVEPTVCRLFGLLTGPPPTQGPPPVYELLSPYFYNMQAFLYVHLVSKAFGLHGFSTSVHNACSSGAFAIEIAAQRIRSGQAEVMIVVGGEAFDTGVRLEWFRRLDLYARDSEGMRPFDSTSSGFYVGEGAGAMVLESAAHASKRGATPYATYAGGAFAHQGWKQTIPDVRAGRLRGVIESAFQTAGVRADEIDLVVPHGASTALSDGYEAACLKEALGSRAERAVATVFKPYVGHMLAACGVIETIASLLAMKYQSVPGTLNSNRRTAFFPVPLVTSQTDREVHTVLKLSTGFTGHDAALLFRRACC
jgi:3-oxoacyl-[acyl-carrier-protein] synthase II